MYEVEMKLSHQRSSNQYSINPGIKFFSFNIYWQENINIFVWIFCKFLPSSAVSAWFQPIFGHYESFTHSSSTLSHLFTAVFVVRLSTFQVIGLFMRRKCLISRLLIDIYDAFNFASIHSINMGGISIDVPCLVRWTQNKARKEIESGGISWLGWSNTL